MKLETTSDLCPYKYWELLNEKYPFDLKSDVDSIYDQYDYLMYILNKDITLEMFVPAIKVGDTWRVLEDPELTMCQGDGQVYYGASEEDWEEANKKVLFKIVEIYTKDLVNNKGIIHLTTRNKRLIDISMPDGLCVFYRKIKDLIPLGIPLTEIAIEKLK